MSQEEKPPTKLEQQCAERKAERAAMKRKKRGRPKKSELKANSRGGRGVRGRPKGDAAIINDYKARMLTSPKSEKVLQSIFDAALNDEHKHQAAAWKLVMDRVAPVSYFEKDKLSGGKSAIQINISGLGQPDIEAKDPAEEAVEDADYEVIDQHAND